MKKLIIYTLAAMLAVSCSVLDIEPESAWSSKNYFNTESQLRSALAGGYDCMQSAFSTDFVTYGDLRSGLYVYQRSTSGSMEYVLSNSLTSDLGYASWSKFYKVIQQANLVIYYADDMLDRGVITSEAASDCKGQALCMRAYTYFWITRVWGDAPLVIVPNLSSTQGNFTMTRTPQTEIFAQIHTDLQAARDLLPASAASKVYFSEPAAYHIDAQVYAWEKNWAKTLESAQAIMKSISTKPFNNSAYTLAKLYDAALVPGATTFITDVVPTLEFVRMFNEGNGAESIFEIAYSIEDNETNDGIYGMFVSDRLVSPRPALNDAYDLNDWRKYATFGSYTDRIFKYAFGYTKEKSARNAVMLRYAEVGLLKAEALMNLAYEDGSALTPEVITAYKAEAIAILNELRKRAGGDVMMIDAVTAADWDKDTAMAALLAERMVELAAEGHRYFDLIRFGKVAEFIGPINGQTDNPLNYVWPIALSEIRNSNGLIEQNEYYK